MASSSATINDSNFVRNINEQFGRGGLLERRKLRELPLNKIYRILSITPRKSEHGRSIVVQLQSNDENIPFQVFLPSRMVEIFPDQQAIDQFQQRVGSLRILEHLSNRSVNIEFIAIHEADQDSGFEE